MKMGYLFAGALILWALGCDPKQEQTDSKPVENAVRSKTSLSTKDGLQPQTTVLPKAHRPASPSDSQNLKEKSALDSSGTNVDALLGEYELRYTNYNTPPLSDRKFTPGCPAIVKKSGNKVRLWSRCGFGDILTSKEGVLRIPKFGAAVTNDWGYASKRSVSNIVEGSVLLRSASNNGEYRGSNRLKCSAMRFFSRMANEPRYIGEMNFEISLVKTGPLREEKHLPIKKSRIPGLYKFQFTPTVNLHEVPTKVPVCYARITTRKNKRGFQVTSAKGSSCFEGVVKMDKKNGLRFRGEYKTTVAGKTLSVKRVEYLPCGDLLPGRFVVTQKYDLGSYEGEVNFHYSWGDHVSPHFFKLIISKIDEPKQPTPKM